MSATLSMLELPMPEDDDMSEEAFEGYLDDDDDDDDLTGQVVVITAMSLVMVSKTAPSTLLNRMMLDIPPFPSLIRQLVVLRT